MHVNRTLKEPRAEGMIQLHENRLKILRWDKLEEAADFDPEYLHLAESANGGASGGPPVP